MKRLFCVGFALCLLLLLPGRAETKRAWHAASVAELEAFLPARAGVEKERIETEMRTASGIVDDRGHMIAGVVLITAGYSADGKYSHYLLTQSPMTIGEISLPAGAYVIGWKRVEDGLRVSFFLASTGAERGTTTAHLMTQPGRVEVFRIWPPGDRRIIQIGRFMLPYGLPE